jgi:predicted phosphate transport protein (TIGR00153 family)
MANIFNLLAPKERKFFPMFESASANLVDAAKVLNDLVNTPAGERRSELIRKIEDLEHKGDDITHDIFNYLSATFITPFDREDIHTLTSAMDDIIDFIHGSSKRIDLYKVDQLSGELKKLAELILRGVEELHIAVLQLKNLKNTAIINEACVKINSLENHADDIYNRAIADLFDNEKDPIMIIKLKEIYSALEIATDKCEDAANVIKTIVIKYS